MSEIATENNVQQGLRRRVINQENIIEKYSTHSIDIQSSENLSCSIVAYSIIGKIQCDKRLIGKNIFGRTK